MTDSDGANDSVGLESVALPDPGARGAPGPHPAPADVAPELYDPDQELDYR